MIYKCCIIQSMFLPIARNNGTYWKSWTTSKLLIIEVLTIIFYYFIIQGDAGQQGSHGPPGHPGDPVSSN